MRDQILPLQESYSQNREDQEIQTLLAAIDLRDGIYIDVGANQPSHLSNTYLFYRRGSFGVLVEPDQSNFHLLTQFRPHDITIRALVGAESGLCQFNYAVFSVYNSVKPLPEDDLLRQEYIPQITIDQIVNCIAPNWVYLLNTDTEGNDLNVLQGAKQSLNKILLICTEYHGDQEYQSLVSYLQEHGFELVFRNNLNLIFRNINLLKSLPYAKT